MRKFVIVIVLLSVLMTACKKEEVHSAGKYIVHDGQLTVILENAVTDVDGNTYNAVQIGDQVWMAENLKTTKYADGTNISLGSSTSTNTAYRYYPGNDANSIGTLGYLYNWPAVMHNYYSSSGNPSGVHGICPNGWHVPSDAEWTQLADFLRQSNFSSIIVPVFNAVHAGLYDGKYSLYSLYSYGGCAYFWSATQDNSCSNAYARNMSGTSAQMYSGTCGIYFGFSVRCVKD